MTNAHAADRAIPRKLRWAALGSGSAAVAVALLMALAPASLAARPGVTLTAPYAGTKWSPNDYASTSCGGTASVVSPVSWSGTSGFLKGAVKASDKLSNCPAIGQSGSSAPYADAAGYETVGIPFSGVSGATVNISVNFHYKETTTGSSGGTFGCVFAPVIKSNTYQNQDCYTENGWSLEFEAYLWDMTNHTVVSQDYAYAEVGNYSYTTIYSDYNGTLKTFSNYSFTYNCSPYMVQYPTEDYSEACLGTGTHSGSLHLWLANYVPVAGGGHVSDTMLKSHHYEVVIGFELYDYVYMGAFDDASPTSGAQPTLTGTAHDSFATNAATKGNLAALTSIVL